METQIKIYFSFRYEELLMTNVEQSDQGHPTPQNFPDTDGVLLGIRPLYVCGADSRLALSK